MKKIFAVLSLFVLLTLVNYSNVEASTYAIGNANGYVYATADLNKDIYAPGEEVRAINISMYSYSPIVGQVQLGASANGGNATLLYQYIANGQTVVGSNTIIGYAQNSVGTYNAGFLAGYYVNPIVISVYAGEDGVGNATDTQCLAKAYTNSEVVSEDINVTVRVTGLQGGPGYQSNTIITGYIDVVIPAGSTESQFVGSYFGNASGAHPQFWCQPGGTYDSWVHTLSPTISNGREVLGQ